MDDQLEVPNDGYVEKFHLDTTKHRLELHLYIFPKEDAPGEVTIVSSGAEVIPTGVLDAVGSMAMRVRELPNSEKAGLALDWLRATIT